VLEPKPTPKESPVAPGSLRLLCAWHAQSLMQHAEVGSTGRRSSRVRILPPLLSLFHSKSRMSVIF